MSLEIIAPDRNIIDPIDKSTPPVINTKVIPVAKMILLEA
jgi:hypothetical protein